MTFLNLIMLGGLTAATLPIIIHLLNRQRFQIMPWGAMHLLENVLKKHTRRIKWEHIILLIVRTAIPLFIALCMARPVLTGMQQLAGGVRSSQVVILDNSLSMEGGSAGKSNFAVAREQAAKIASELPRGSEIAIVGMAGAIQELAEPSSDAAQAAQRLRVTAGGFGIAHPAPAIETASGLFATRLHNADRALTIISDFQKVSWSAEDSSARVRAMDLLRAQAVPPRVTLFRTGDEIKDNVAVENIELSRSIIGIGQKIQARANIRNYGPKAYPDLRVFFRIDGVEKSASQVNLAPNGSAQVLFTYAFEKAGSHIVEVRADADSLKADNVAQASIPVLDQLPVLLISGDTNPEPLRSETAFLEIALQPYSLQFKSMGIAPQQGLADLIASSVIPEAQFSAKDLASTKVVVMANVRQLTDDQLGAIQSYVRDGGGLLVFTGDRIDIAWYNNKLAGDGRGLLPGKLGALKAVAAPSDDAPASTPPGIVVQHYDHPAMAIFNDPKNGTLRGVQVRQWYHVDPAVSDAASAAAPVVAAKLDTGEPLFIDKPFGEGRVILCATACDADWGNLPMKPAFLPLMQQLVTHLASKVYPPRNVSIGQRLGAFVSPDMGGKRAVMTTPDNQKIELAITKKETHGVIEYEGTARPGLYLLELPDGQALHFVVRPPTAESNPERVNEEGVQLIAKQMGATLVNSWEEYAKADRERRHGREIWQGLMWFALGLIFVEILLVQFVTRRNP